MRLAVLAGTTLTLAACFLLQAGDVSLRSCFTDNMVLQRDTPIRIAGRANPGGEIRVSLDGKSATATANPDGSWKAELPAMPAGGPFTLEVEGKDKVTLRNVMVGEVWICSGQSNMQYPLAGWGREKESCDKAIAAADHPEIRLFNVDRKLSPFAVKDDLEGKWQVCAPATAKDFSAVGYYFGLDLQKKLKVPVGLVNSSWGGTRIEPWISRVGFESSEDFRPLAAQIDPAAAKEKLTPETGSPKVLQDWAAMIEKANAQGWDASTLDATTWGEAKVPGTLEAAAGKDIDGAVWFSKSVELPADWANKSLRLVLGKVDDCDVTYFNGVEVGRTGPEVKDHWAVSRTYDVPGKLVKPGANVLTIRVFDHFSNGGLVGPELFFMDVASKGKVNLAGAWKFKVEYAIDYAKFPRRPVIPVSPIGSQFQTTLYNAMIHPFTYMAVRGAIWYQGESNAGAAKDYRKLQPLLVADWRRAFDNPELVFLWTQLAAFQQHSPTTPLVEGFFASQEPSDPAWAHLREAQLQSLEVPKTGMAVTIDIGDPIDIHPTNKQDVGARLALAAEKIAYGMNVQSSGPVYNACMVEGGKLKLSFKELGGGLVAKGGKLKGFAIAGEDKKFVWADAVIEGDDVVVWSDKVPHPVAARYAWSMYPEGCNLFNQAGLPASPFRTDAW